MRTQTLNGPLAPLVDAYDTTQAKNKGSLLNSVIKSAFEYVAIPLPLPLSQIHIIDKNKTKSSKIIPDSKYIRSDTGNRTPSCRDIIVSAVLECERRQC